jgi:hypothetical protein
MARDSGRKGVPGSMASIDLNESVQRDQCRQSATH